MESGGARGCSTRQFHAGRGIRGKLLVAFFYPPPFLLICLPLALLPYGVAVAVWVRTTGAACIAVVRALLPTRWPAALVLLAFPPMLINAAHGQNGALALALLGVAVIHLDRRAWLAGICLGVMCFRPQLTVVFVHCNDRGSAMAHRSLDGWGRWQEFCQLRLSLPLEKALGGDSCPLHRWRGQCWSSAESALQRWSASEFCAGAALAGGRYCGRLDRSGARLSGGPCRCAASGPAPRTRGACREGAVLATAACLVTPFLLDYDLMLLAIPLAWVAAEAERSSYLPWEKLILACAFLLPLVVRPLAMWIGAPMAPPVLLALLWVVVRRASGPRLSSGKFAG